MKFLKFAIFLLLSCLNINFTIASSSNESLACLAEQDDCLFNRAIMGISQSEVLAPVFDIIFPFMAQAIKSSKSDKIDIVDDLICWCQLEPNALHRNIFVIEILNQVNLAAQNQKNFTTEDYQVISNNILTSLKKLASHISPISEKQKQTKQIKLKKRLILVALLFITITITITIAVKLYDLAREQEQLKLQNQTLTQELAERNKELLVDFEKKLDECDKAVQELLRDAKISQSERTEIMRRQILLRDGVKNFSDEFQKSERKIMELVAQRRAERPPTAASRVIKILDFFSGFDNPVKAVKTVSKTMDEISDTARSLISSTSESDREDAALTARLDQLRRQDTVPVTTATSLSIASLLPAVPTH